MEISAVNNGTDIIKRPKLHIVSGNCETTDKQQVQQQSQELPEDRENRQVSEEQIKNTIAKINKSLEAHCTKLDISFHDKTNEIMIRVVDTNTGEVIREIPSEKSLERLAMALKETGLLVDEKV